MRDKLARPVICLSIMSFVGAGLCCTSINGGEYGFAAYYAIVSICVGIPSMQRIVSGDFSGESP